MASEQSEVKHHRPLHEREYDDDRDDRINQYEDASPEEIEADIRRTRAEMDQTLDELQQRLNPRSLWQEVVGLFRSKKQKDQPDATDASHEHQSGAADKAKSAGKWVLQKVRDHPVPAVLLSTAVTTLIYESASRRKSSKSRPIRSINIYRGEPTMYGGSHVHAQSGQPYRESSEHTGERVGQYRSQNPGQAGQSGQSGGQHEGQQQFQFRSSHSESERSGAMQRASGKISEMKSQAGEKISQAGESVRGSVKHAGESVRSGVQHAGEQVKSSMQHMRQGASNVGEKMRHGMESTKDFVEERPLAVGIGALALGLIAGLLIPRTQRENQLMGEKSERFIERSKDVGKDVIDRGKHVAEEAMHAAAEAASEETERQGLKPE